MHYLQRELYDRIKADNEIFDFLQRSSLDGLWYWDLDNPEQEWMNDQFWKTLGYDPDEMPHLSSARQNIIHPEDGAAALERARQHVDDPSIPYDQVVRYQHKQGHTVYIRRRGMALRDATGRATRLLGAHIDVTREKEKEILLENSQKAARIGTWSMDLRTGAVYWDAMTREIHQTEPDYVPSLEQGINFYKPGTSRDTIVTLFNRAVEEGKPFDTELQLVTARGQDIWVRAIGRPEMIADKCVRIYGIFQDIDLRRRNEERVLNYSILEAKSREMEQFAYAASHDLREPLLTIEGYLNMIREDYAEELPGEVLSFMEIISGAAGRMDDLIKGLLDYSRLSEIKRLQPVDLKKLFHVVITDLHSAIENTDVQFTHTDLPVVDGYPLELKMLLQNLIGNAIKYRKVTVPLKIDVSHAPLPNGVEITVKDNGIGIAEKDLKAVFKLFRRLHGQEAYSGNGIGLANCKKIVELHGGDIWVESTLGEGSSFRFTIGNRAYLEEK